MGHSRLEAWQIKAIREGVNAGFSWREIAKKAGCSTGLVGKYKHRSVRDYRNGKTPYARKVWNLWVLPKLVPLREKVKQRKRRAG